MNLSEIKNNYKMFDNYQIEKIVSNDLDTLRPEAVSILKEEIEKRNLSEELLKKVKLRIQHNDTVETNQAKEQISSSVEKRQKIKTSRNKKGKGLKNLLIYVSLFFIGIMISTLFNSNDDSPSLNIDDEQAVLEYVQGKWHGTNVNSLRKREEIKILIEGNKMTIWRGPDNEWEKGFENKWTPNEIDRFDLSHKNKWPRGPLNSTHYGRSFRFKTDNINFTNFRLYSYGIVYAGEVRTLKRGW